jgi:hypothetical protein
MQTYYISGGRDNWTATNANTLLGAKMAASRVYHLSREGVMLVAVARPWGHEIVAVRHGYGPWRTA